MRLVGIKSLMPGDVLAMAISSSSGKIILNSGVELTEQYINKLKQLNVNNVYIEDERFNDVEMVEPLDAKTKNTVAQVIKDIYESLHKGKNIDEYIIKDISKIIVDCVREYKDKGVSILSIEAVDEYIIEHSMNVAILTAFMGNRMNYNFNQISDLVTGALVHDLGRENIKDEKPEHTQKGFDVMRKYRGLNLHSTLVCYEHHENFDGTGYPRKIKGKSISEFTRIVSVADFYDNVLHGINSENVSLMPHQAYEHILAVSGKILDPDIVEVFRDTIVFYPNGCTVLLSNGLKGVVVRQNLGSPQRPQIRIYNDNKIIGEVDLVKSLTLFIKDVIVV